MTANVTFYQLEESQVMAAATPLVAECYRARQTLAIVCDDQATAEQWDEHLWQQPTDAFIPHNLFGEGPANGSPVTLVWAASNYTAPTMMNVSQQTLPISPRVQRIIEFVPADEEGKKAARQRYKQYQMAGCQMQFLPLSKETTNG
jgi:DNA polymerase-3 subunit chi